MQGGRRLRSGFARAFAGRQPGGRVFRGYFRDQMEGPKGRSLRGRVCALDAGKSSFAPVVGRPQEGRHRLAIRR